jgi:DNA repair exonuclease SbcCD ATPase subunit
MTHHNIQFRRLTVSNFLSVGAPIVVDFPDYVGLNYVYGFNHDLDTKNGSGKSTIFVDAILFALFGKTLRPITRKHIPNRNYACEGDTEVRLELEVGKDKYVITRGMTKHRQLPTMMVTHNGINVTKGSADATNSFIETNILKSNWNVFKNCIVLSSNEQNSFLKMKSGEKRKFVEEVFDLAVFGNMETKVKEDVKKVESELLSTQKMIKKIQLDVAQFEDERTKHEDNKKERLRDLVTEMKDKKVQYQLANKEVESYEEEKVELSAKLSKFDVETFKKLKDSEIQVTSKVKQLKSENTSSKKYLAKYEDILSEIGELCCLPRVKDKFKIDETLEQISTRDETIEKFYQIGKKLSSQNKILQTRKDQYEKDKHSVTAIDIEIRHLKSKEKDCIRELKRLQKEVTSVEDHQPFKELIKQNTEQLNSHVDVFKGYVTRQQYLQAVQLIVSADGVKKFVIKDLIDILNNRIQFYLKKMNSSYTCIFDSNFDCTFVTETGECSYDNFSTGERARINISVLFAFREMLFNQGNLISSILVLDEFLDSGLDEQAVVSLMEILTELKDSGQVESIILISHRECVDDADFDNIITVIKEGGFSRISN